MVTLEVVIQVLVIMAAQAAAVLVPQLLIQVVVLDLLAALEQMIFLFGLAQLARVLMVIMLAEAAAVMEQIKLVLLVVLAVERKVVVQMVPQMMAWPVVLEL
jgi:hypothetical protein